MGQDPSTIRQEIEQTRGEMGETVEALGYKTDVKTRAKNAISDKVGSAKDKLGSARDSVSGATPDAGEMKQGARRAKGIAEENPLGLAIGAAAVGFVVGLLVPSTGVEDEKIGPVAERSSRRPKRLARRHSSAAGRSPSRRPRAPKRPRRRPASSRRRSCARRRRRRPVRRKRKRAARCARRARSTGGHPAERTRPGAAVLRTHRGGPMQATRPRRYKRETQPQGRFQRASSPRYTRTRPSVRRAGGRRQEGKTQGAFGRIAGLAPGLLGRSGRSRGKGASGGPLGMLSRLTGGRKRGGGGLPINPKMLTGLLGAGAAGTALIRKRRAGRADSPDVTPVSAADRNETDRVAG